MIVMFFPGIDRFIPDFHFFQYTFDLLCILNIVQNLCVGMGMKMVW